MTQNAVERSALPYRPCVGVAVFNANGQVFIGRRVGFSAADSHAWQMPQGGIDDGETPLAAAKRELYEETGLVSVEPVAEAPEWLSYDLPPGTKKKWADRYRGQTQKWFAFRFLGDDAEIDLTVHGKPEFEAWRWAQLHETPGLIVPFKRGVYEAVVDIFGPIAGLSG